MTRFPGVVFWGTANVTVGERVSIGSGAFLLADCPIAVGHDTMIATRALILTSTHRVDNHPMWKERVSRPIEIGSHVWIGAGAIVLPGVRIGDFAVVGGERGQSARAVVRGGGGESRADHRHARPGALDERAEYPGVPVYEDFLPETMITKRRNESHGRPYGEPPAEGNMECGGR